MFIKSKLVLLTVSLLLSSSVLADGRGRKHPQDHGYNRGHNHNHNYNHGYNRGHNHNYNRGYNNNWIAPALIGGAIVGSMIYGVTRPDPVYVAPDPVYVNPQIPYGYHYETIFDGNCNCYRRVLIQD
jgi:hypothetical protein